MTLDAINRRGLVLLGCGKMGSALLAGWLAGGLQAQSVWVVEPYPSDWLQGLVAQGLHLNDGMPVDPAVAMVAVKPQMMGEALPQLISLAGSNTLLLSIAAGTKLSSFEAIFGGKTRLVRAMPNTPAAVGRGITAIIGNAMAQADDLDLAELLLSCVGEVVRLDNEAQIDAVTAVSGSGPAYVFNMIEALAAAAVAEGLPDELAMKLARATVTGSGELAYQAQDTAAQLRINVTSPGGTTAAALTELMDTQTGLTPLMIRAVKAAAERGRELGK